MKIEEEYEAVYENKIIRSWWLIQKESFRRDMLRRYFVGGNSEQINTLYGIMPEEMEEIYNINYSKILEVNNLFERVDVKDIISEIIQIYAPKYREKALEYFEINH